MFPIVVDVHIYISSLGAQVSLQNAAIYVIEDEGPAEVCVDLLGGELAIDITVLLNTNDLTADGRLMYTLFIVWVWICITYF